MQQPIHMYWVSRTDILMTIEQFRDDLIQGFSLGQFFTKKGAFECQD